MDTSLQSLDHVKASILDMAVRFGPKLIVAIVILVIGYIVGKWVGRVLDRLLTNLNLHAPVRSLLERIAHILVLGFFAVIALQNLGIELLPLIAGLGVAGAGVALAMQGLLGNLFAGFVIIFTRPYSTGDYISIGDEEGEVLTISLFSTALGHLDKSKVVMPNRKIVGEILHNYGRIRQINIIVSVAYATDMDTALRLIKEALSANAHVLAEPAPVIIVKELADSGVNIRVAPWVHVPDYETAMGEINKAILETFRTQDISIPFPQREIRILGDN